MRTSRPRPVFAFVLSSALGAAGCASSAAGSAPAAAEPGPSAAGDVERFFPIEDGKIYHYETSEGGTPGMLVAKAKRVDATHGELQMSSSTTRVRFEPGGVARDGGAYLLKAPLEVGASWPGEHGGTTRIVAVDAAVDVPAGTYASCVKTVEEGGRVPGARYESTYCPGVGLVLLVASASGAEARAALKSYGLPVKID